MSSTPLRRLLITGATGKQGGAVISALLAKQPNPPFHILALTRNAKSPRAETLSRKGNVTVVEGDLDDCTAIFKKIQSPIHGVFSVQVPLKPKVEEQQGKALIDAAASHGVKHFMYTSADRGGVERSDQDGTTVPHFRSKFNIEQHLKAVTEKQPNDRRMEWTIIRPVAFMENLTPNFIGRAFATMWRQNGMDKKLQLVSSVDIGVLAADVFKNQPDYSGKAISIATDDLSPTEAETIFKRVTGTEMPRTYDWLGSAIKYVLYGPLGSMFEWFKDVGFGADPKAHTTKFSEMRGFERWLRERSGFKHLAK